MSQSPLAPSSVHTGIMPALLTPFDADMEIDHAALTATVERLVTAGVDGVVANGTLAEAQSMSVEEQRAAIGTVVDAAAERCPVTVGISGAATRDVMELAAVAGEEGAAAVMCLPPLSYRASGGELLDFFFAVADAAGRPVMVYNNPATAKNDLSPDLLVELAQHPSIVSVKECSGDARRIAAIRNAAPDGFDVLVGGDDWALEGFSAGATGWVSGVAVVAPTACLELFRLVQEGRLADARALYSRMLPLARLDMTDKLIQYFKAALDSLGLGGGLCRRPRLPLDEHEQRIVVDALAALMESGLVGEGAR